MSDEEKDELDALLDQYTAEAAAQTKKVLAGPRKKGYQVQGQKRAREEALATPIGSENKGYQEGQGIGASAKGMAQPIELNLKTGRGGLGVEEAKKKQREQAAEEENHARLQRAASVLEDQKKYSERAKSDYELRRCLQQLELGWKSSQQLERNRLLGVEDQRQVEEMVIARLAQLVESLPALWPEEEIVDETAEDTETMGKEACSIPDPLARLKAMPLEERPSIPIQTQLSTMIRHLRQNLYCMYCGCTFHDVHDMASSCPGETEEEH
eukprot:gene23302-30539_t